MTDWNVRRAERVCAAGGEVLAPDEPFYSALHVDTETVERRDYCAECWSAQHEAQPGAFAYWRLRGPEVEEDATAIGPLDMKGIRRLLTDDLLRDTAPPGVAGLLGLMLVRKKLAKLRDVDRDSIRIQFKGDDEPIAVPAVDLGGAALERAQSAMWQILDMMGGKAPPATA